LDTGGDGVCAREHIRVLEKTHRDRRDAIELDVTSRDGEVVVIHDTS
jgi:hypothetical protein